MATFPNTKNDILILAAKVAAGITANPVDYQDPPFDALFLSHLVGEAIDLVAQRQTKQAELDEIVVLENEKIAEVAAKLRTYLDQAEALYKDDPPKLHEIDWDVPSDPKHDKPGRVRDLEAVDQGAATVELDWKSPLRTANTGRPAAYKITRETRSIETHEAIEEFGTWESMAFKTMAILMNQPRGVEIRYRVIASNINGDGPPEDAERVVL